MKIKESLEIEKNNQNQPVIEPGIWHPSLFEWRDVIEDYLIVSRKRMSNRLAMSKLQLEIMGDIYNSQEAIKMYKDILVNKKNIVKYGATEADIDENNLKFMRDEIKRDKLVIKSLKEIIDGHLWRMFKFNRSLLYCLGIENDPGYFELNQGGLQELNNWSKQVNDEYITSFVLNSLSNYARIGDVIVKKIDGSIEVKEIKSSKLASGIKQKRRLLSQNEKRKNFVSFANKNRGKINKKVIHIENSTVMPSYHFKKLSNMLSEAEIKGVSSHILNDYLGIIIEDYSKPKLAKKEYTKLIDNLFRSIKKGSDIILPADSQIRKKYSPNFTPLSIFPIDEKYIADLILGKKRIYYYLNLSEIFRYFEKNGWTILSTFFDEKAAKNNDETPFCIMRHKELTVSVPWLIINQVIFDFLDLDSVIELYEYTYKQKNIKKERILYNFKNNDLWI